MMAAGGSDGDPGEVTSSEAFQILQQDSTAQIVDVRTRAEWAFVGVPDLSELGKEAVLVEWQRYPDMAVAPDFVATLEAELEGRGARRDSPILFLCRSGVRSLAAAQVMARAGWTGSRNVAGGFEGPPDPDRHRSRVDGWKASGLPWIQS